VTSSDVHIPIRQLKLAPGVAALGGCGRTETCYVMFYNVCVRSNKVRSVDTQLPIYQVKVFRSQYLGCLPGGNLTLCPCVAPVGQAVPAA
jgi:hypothetical protein